MSWASRTRLRRAYRNKLSLAVQNALDPTKASQLSTDVETLERYSKLLSMGQSRFTADAAIGIAVAALCIAIAAVMWSHKIASTSVVLTVETESLQGALAHGWQIETPLHGSLMHFERMGELDAPNLGLSINEPAGDAWVTFEGGHITLQSFQIDSGALLHLATDADQLSMFVSRKPLSGRVTISGKGVMTFGKRSGDLPTRREYNIAIAETLDFSVANATETPARVTVHHAGKWSLGRVPLAGVGFAVEEGRGIAESAFISGLKSGSIQFNDTSWPRMDLFEHERFSIRDTSAAAVEIRSSEPNLRVNLTGTVKNVTKGTAEANRELAPSYLEYMYNKKSLGLFWAAIALAWGVLWGIRKTIFR
jgi:hypothetical protein